ncbi:MAG: hypothetical protein JWR09_611, partial [Mucilaginibacter sp.]|nr:hypothetical protein [Mucilaginibacter sp.]
QGAVKYMPSPYTLCMSTPPENGLNTIEDVAGPFTIIKRSKKITSNNSEASSVIKIFIFL